MMAGQIARLDRADRCLEPFPVPAAQRLAADQVAEPMDALVAAVDAVEYDRAIQKRKARPCLRDFFELLGAGEQDHARLRVPEQVLYLLGPSASGRSAR